MIDLPKYNVVRCTRCGNIQVTMARKSFTCARCGKHLLFRKVKIFGGHDNPGVASKLCIEIKGRMFKWIR